MIKNTKKDKTESAVLRQYYAIKEQYRDCIIFFRLGDFYEMFCEDAVVGSKELDLTLTGKSCGLEERAPMCGVPYHSYESYAEKLVKKGYKVAICEQTPNIVDKIVQREVVRVITPGTLIDSSMLTERANSYMMCVYKTRNEVSYAYADLSTGEIAVGEYNGKNVASYINDQIVRIMPSEIICNNEVIDIERDIPCIERNNFKLNLYYDWAFSYSNAERILLKQYSLNSLHGYDFDSTNCVIALGALLEYFKETQMRDLMHMRMPRLIKDDQFMYLDTNTRRNLEIEASMRDGSKYATLLWVLDNTCTAGGARLLRSWVRLPLQNKSEIEKRQDMIESLVKNPAIMTELKLALDQIQDIERIVGKISYGNVMPKDCLALAYSLENAPKVKTALINSNQKDLINLADALVDTTALSNLILSAIKENPPAILKDGDYIKDGFNSDLDEQRHMKDTVERDIINMQESERQTTGIKNLKIGYNKVYGYYIEVNKSMTEYVPFNYIRKQTVSNNERYITEQLKNYEEKILNSHENALKLEEQIYNGIKEQLKQNTLVLQRIASAISTADCIYSLSSVAVTNDYVRPNMLNTRDIQIVAGRHPVVEKLLKNADFIPNDCTLNDSDDRTMILTGPNMAGKSTYMRQVALITYMAHIGSFVPARSAKIGIVDRIFTRIGASDDLAVGQSTFMVEMIEVSNILNYATNNSLIILDEVGRGTSTYDGLSIAWSVIEYLSKHLKAKTLFATHYHELMQLEGKLDGVKNYCISIKEVGGRLVFLRRIMRGSATKSYGIEVAGLAGLPKSVIDRAKELLSELTENKDKNLESSNSNSEIVNILKEIDINKMSPISAFETLSHLIELVK